jgi:DNA-binding XRE family transcriptional regulator
MLTLKKYRVMEYAEKAGYGNQGELADAIGVSRQWMSTLLNGKATPTTDQLVALSQLFGCRIDDIADYPKVAALALTAI